MIDGVLYINGERCKREQGRRLRRPTTIGAETRRRAIARRCRTASATTTLDLDAERRRRQHRRSTWCRAGHYFMMGDNRDNSTDSRVRRQRRRRLRAVRESRRPRRDHLLLGRGRRAGLGVLALAVDGPLGPAVHASYEAMAADAAARRRSKRRLGYRFADRELLTTRADPFERRRRAGARATATSGSNSSATGCSAWSSPRCCSQTFPEAAEGELSPRLTALVRKETCAEVARRRSTSARRSALGGGEAQSRRPQQGGDPRRRLRGGDRRDLSRRRPRGRAALHRAALARAHARPATGRCATPRRRCRNGRRARGLPTPTYRDRRAAAARTTRRASTSRSRVDGARRRHAARAARAREAEQAAAPRRAASAKASGRRAAMSG